MASKLERLGASTGKDVHVLCYQHHTKMLLKSRYDSGEALLYACMEPACLIRYHSLDGYFLDVQDPKMTLGEITPHLICPNDGHVMYLAKTLPERRSFRLWKCPECEAALMKKLQGAGKKRGSVNSG